MIDVPLYAIFQDGEWFFVDEEIWLDMQDRLSAADDDQDENSPVELPF